MNHNLQELLEAKGKEDEKRLARSIYKWSNCGVSFDATPTGVVVCGYCEGVDLDCPSRELSYPFTEEAFDGLVEQADNDGCQLWDETHGCDDCPVTDTGYHRIDPDCPSCHGEGRIL